MKYGLQKDEIFSPCDAAGLYLREEFLQAGGFGEDYFSYFEDEDLGVSVTLEPEEIRGNIFNTMLIHPPRHLVWSTDTLNLSDPFQKRWLLRQTLTHGRAEDIRALDLVDIRRELDQLGLPKEIESLWRRYLEYSDAKSKPN